ncbi:Uncharacterised protein [Klebsiella oxytoca]|nr:Uncharacterised protein [Klebsiella oxytoca]
MKPAALFTLHGTAYNQLSNLYQVTQLQQIIRDTEASVVFVQLLLQHSNTAQGAFKTTSGTHDADIIPHQQAQLMPVVLYYDQFIRYFDLAFVPGRQFIDRLSERHTLNDIFGSGPAVNKALQQ